MTRIVRLLPYLALAALAVLVRLPFLEVPMISDEGGYAYVAHFWADDYLPYRDVPFDRPQGIFLLYRLALAFGEGVGTIRLFAALWNAVAAVLCLLTIRTVFGADRARAGAWIGATAYALFSAAPRIEGFTANAELFTLPLLTLAALFTWRRRWLWAGLAAGAATAVKPVGAAGLLLGLAWIVVLRSGWRDAARLGAGFAVAPLLCLAHGAMIGWDAYWSSFVDRRLLLYSAASMGAGEQFGLLIDGVKDTASSWLLVATAAMGTMLVLRNRAAAFVGLWIASSIAGMAMGGLWHWHYFQQLVPPLAVGAGGCLIAWRRESPSPRRLALRGIWVAAGVAAAALFVRAEAGFWFKDPGDVSWELYRRPAYLMADEIGRFVRGSTDEDATMYVAFAEAELYYAARRKAAVPQLYYRDVEYSEPLFREAVACVARRTPAVVVKAQAPPPAWMEREAFLDILQRGYVKTAESRSVSLWVRKP